VGVGGGKKTRGSYGRLRDAGVRKKVRKKRASEALPAEGRRSRSGASGTPTSSPAAEEGEKGGGGGGGGGGRGGGGGGVTKVAGRWKARTNHKHDPGRRAAKKGREPPQGRKTRPEEERPAEGAKGKPRGQPPPNSDRSSPGGGGGPVGVLAFAHTGRLGRRPSSPSSSRMPFNARSARGGAPRHDHLGGRAGLLRGVAMLVILG